MSKIQIDLTPVAQDLESQLKSLVPVRTGRLRKSIKYQIEEDDSGYVISFLMEDYFKWLKPRRLPMTLPSPRELAMANPPLPKMNTLGKVRKSDLSSRSQGIIDSLNINAAVSLLDRDVIYNQIKDILEV